MSNITINIITALLIIGFTSEGISYATEEKSILYWVAPMDPNYQRDKPGKSPMGMDLVPFYAQDEGAEPGIIINPEIIQNLGVRYAVAETTQMWRTIDTVGYVDFDESQVSHIHLRAKGWIENLKVRSEGERVEKGQHLFDLYSPDLVNVQQEFVQALRIGAQGLINASRARLNALGISMHTIKKLEDTQQVKQTVAIYATQAGVVSALDVREGMYVEPKMRIMTLGDLSSVWILAEVFESQANWVGVDQRAEIQLSFLPGEIWQGKVEYIYPSLNKKTRTLKVRLRFENPNEKLKPNMYAQVKIFGDINEKSTVIPPEALIRTGREERVILANGAGRFEPRIVTAGIENEQWVEIKEGLQSGDRVVISGQFLIDSEASMKASTIRMTPLNSSPDILDHDMEKISGFGVVVDIIPVDGILKLKHDPIDVISWPAMTMDFSTGDGVRISELKLGDHVAFELENQDGKYVIKAIQNRDELEAQYD